MSNRLRHVLGALNAPWAITPDGFETVCAILDRRAAGVHLSDRAISAAIKESRAEFEARHEAAGMAMPKGAASGALAVIPVYGTILPRPVADISGGGGCSMSDLMDKIGAADADPTVAHILLDVDSPGGSVSLVPEAAAVIRDARTPISAIANTMCASAAYYLATQADELVVTPSGCVGSIGVFARHVDNSGALAQEGLAVTLISAGDNKTLGNPYEPLSDAARAEIQAAVDECYDEFVAAVAYGRGVPTDDVLAHFGQGSMFSAVAAVGVGMADRVETFDGTVQRLLSSPGQSRPFGARAMRADASETGVLAADETPDEDSPIPAERHDDAATVVTFAPDAEKLLARGLLLHGPDSTGR